MWCVGRREWSEWCHAFLFFVPLSFYATLVVDIIDNRATSVVTVTYRMKDRRYLPGSLSRWTHDCLYVLRIVAPGGHNTVQNEGTDFSNVILCVSCYRTGSPPSSQKSKK